jgi:hypothetical protein
MALMPLRGPAARSSLVWITGGLDRGAVCPIEQSLDQKQAETANRLTLFDNLSRNYQRRVWPDGPLGAAHPSLDPLDRASRSGRLIEDRQGQLRNWSMPLTRSG